MIQNKSAGRGAASSAGSGSGAGTRAAVFVRGGVDFENTVECCRTKERACLGEGGRVGKIWKVRSE